MGPSVWPIIRGPACRPAGQTRSVLILPNSLHHLRIESARIAFLYVDPFGRDLAALLTRMRTLDRAQPSICSMSDRCSHCSEISRTDGSPEAARRAARELLGVGSGTTADARVVDAVRLMRDAPCASHALVELCKRAGLSSSRFLHLFKDVTGVPLRRYRIWNRIGAAARAIAQGQSLTEAAHGAGFSSSAHFSSAFRDMFGLMPSELFAQLRKTAAVGVQMAGDGPTCVELLERRIDRLADRHRLRTARMERAARRRPERARHLALDDGARTARLDFRVGDRDRRQQRLRVGMQRAACRARRGARSRRCGRDTSRRCGREMWRTTARSCAMKR